MPASVESRLVLQVHALHFAENQSKHTDTYKGLQPFIFQRRAGLASPHDS